MEEMLPEGREMPLEPRGATRVEGTAGADRQVAADRHIGDVVDAGIDAAAEAVEGEGTGEVTAQGAVPAMLFHLGGGDGGAGGIGHDAGGALGREAGGTQGQIGRAHV